MARRILFGSYELLERIGEGGMAEVWRARSRGVAGFEKTVVIKRVLPSLMARSDFASLLVREARIAALLNHPNVVQIFELGEQDGAYFIAMEYVHGCDLATAVAFQPDCRRVLQTGGLDLSLRLWIALEAAVALDYAHRRRDDEGRPLAIVHRDVSPQNVLLGYEGQVKVADFGIALADQRGLGREENPRLLRGKFAYMSPEQARGEALDRRSDVFSLGIVLWEMIAGRRLFRASDRDETLRRVQEAKVPPLDVAALGAPPVLDEVVRHALAKERDERFPTAAALAEELSQVLVAMGARVGGPELRDALLRIQPPDDASRVNKLRVDLGLRQGEDALGELGEIGGVASLREAPEHTRVLATSRRLESELVPVLFVAARTDAEVFDAVARRHHASFVPSVPDEPCEATFGHLRGRELGLAAALACADEIRRFDPDAAVVIAAGEARVFKTDPPVTDAVPTSRERCLEALRGAGSGELWVDPELAAEVEHRYEVERSSAGWPRLVGARHQARRALDRLRQGPLVGRRDIMQRLSGALEAVAAGRGHGLVLVGGEGAGKSRVVAELCAAVEGEGALVLVAAPLPEDQEVAFAALRRLFSALCGLDEGDTSEHTSDRITRLRHLGLSPRELDRVGELFGGPAPLDRAGRPRGVELAVAFRKALRALAADRPVLVVLDDLGHVDDASRQLLDFLVAGVGGARVLVLMAARPGTPLPHLNVERVWLPHLDVEGGARVFSAKAGARAVEEEVARALHDATDGNPGTIGMLAEALEGQLELSGGIVHGLGELLPVPARLRTRVGASVAALPARARSLVRVVAASPEPIDFPLLAAALGVPRDVAEPVVQRLLSRRVLRGFGVVRRERLSEAPVPGREEPLPARLAIAGGELVRRAVLESLPEADRERIHARLADVLRRSGAAGDERVESLAEHAALAGDTANAPLELELAAEVALARSDRVSAADRLVRAARLGRQGGAAPERGGALVARAAELLIEAGRTERAAMVLEDAPEVDEPGLALRLSFARASVHARREHWREAAQEVESLAASPRWADAEPRLRGRALIVLGRARLESGEVGGAVEAYDAAVDVLRAAGAQPEAGLALCGLATSLARIGADERAREVELDALVMAVRHGTDALRCASLATAAELAEAMGEPAL
ncbi:MAG: protein kinase, partial [Myxococcales bacterium]|nr:protein kinase [Myxococcales bacterium]